MRGVRWLVVGLGCVGCVPDLCETVDPLPDSDIVALGDGILAWNAPRCQSVADHTSLELGVRVENRAERGADLLGASAIAHQAAGGTWSQAIVIGGLQDLLADDACVVEDPRPLIDLLVSDDGTSGAMPDLVADLVSGGSSVLLLGYYAFPGDSANGEGECAPALAILAARYRALAQRQVAVRYLALEPVIGLGDARLRDFDRVHPNVEGAQMLAEVMARSLRGM